MFNKNWKMRPTISCLSERKRNVKDIQSSPPYKLELAFLNDMFTSKVYKDVLTSGGENHKVCWHVANSHKKIQTWVKVGGIESCCALFGFQKTPLFPE